MKSHKSDLFHATQHCEQGILLGDHAWRKEAFGLAQNPPGHPPCPGPLAADLDTATQPWPPPHPTRKGTLLRALLHCCLRPCVCMWGSAVVLRGTPNPRGHCPVGERSQLVENHSLQPHRLRTNVCSGWLVKICRKISLYAFSTV